MTFLCRQISTQSLSRRSLYKSAGLLGFRGQLGFLGFVGICTRSYARRLGACWGELEGRLEERLSGKSD